MATVQPRPTGVIDDGGGPHPTAPEPRARSRRRWIVAGAVAGVVLVAAAGGYWLHARGRVSTDDAFVEARVIHVSPKVGGQVIEVDVTDNQRVRAGEVLLRLDPRDYAAALEQARAQARAADVEARRTAADSARVTRLFERGLVARQDLEHAAAAAQAATANLEAAHQRVQEAALRVSYTTLTAPEAGRVTRKAIEEGMFIQAGQQLMAIVTDDLWVVANFKETQLQGIRPGQPVEIKVDAYPRRRFRGHVDSIQAGTGSRFSLLPSENATGNYVKIVQRVPVKIVFDEPPDPAFPLGPGMSVVPTVSVR